MKNTFFKILKIFTLHMVILQAIPCLATSMLFMGAVQFPSSLKTIPDLRLYCEGRKIKCETFNESKRQLFSLGTERHRSTFYILITKSIDYDTVDKNTIRYLKLKQGQSYKFYRMQLVIKDSEDPERPAYGWDIKEQRLPFNNRIPDDALIVCYNPDYVSGLQGGNAIELPTIHIKQDILSLVGSEATLHEKSVELLLSSLDHDLLHTSVKQELRPNYQQKTILAVTLS